MEKITPPPPKVTQEKSSKPEPQVQKKVPIDGKDGAKLDKKAAAKEAALRRKE